MVAVGWCQKAMAMFVNDDTGERVPQPADATRTLYCALGAIYAADHGRHPSHKDLYSREAAGAMSRVLEAAECKESPGGPVWMLSKMLTTWNDDPARAQEEVVAAFDAAIQRCEAQ